MIEQESELRKELSRILSEEPNNYSRLLEISSKLADFDKNNVRFSVDAGVINRLGKELVGKKETAVSELVKNAYDADARIVDLVFEDSDIEGGTLTISDDGIGMSREELIKGFMRISSTDKIHFPKSPIYKRNRAGRKGIGRFAVQRLGTKLTIITQKQSADFAIQITIKWSDYEGDKNLTTINNQIEVVDKIRESGTDLIIKGLRDKWTVSSIERVYRYVSALIQPFPLSKERINREESRNEVTLDPGFKASFFKKDKFLQYPVADEQSMIYQYSIAIFEGYVDNKGNSYISIKSDRLGIDESIQLGAKKDKPNLQYEHLKDVNFKAYYFIYIPEYIPSQQLRKIVELAQHSGGIRLYRNGFRVLPYGDFGDDWLELDESEKKRILLPRHGNTNFFGFVEVEDPEGKNFEETSSREGLLETESFIELRDFLYRGLTTGVIKVANIREVKVTTSQKGWERKFERPIEKLREITDDIKKKADESNTDTLQIDWYSNKTKDDLTTELVEKNRALRDVALSIENIIKEQEKEDELRFQETGILRVLASLGLSIGIFTHEIRHYLTTMHASVKLLAKKFKDDPIYQERVQRLYDNVNSLRTYTSYFDKTISENVTKELIPQDLPVIVTKFFDVVSLDRENYQVKILDTEIIGNDLFTTPMHSSEWATILYNLYTNALKAINRVKTKGKIFIRIGKENHKIFLEFFDNGDGIPEENRSKVFDAFYTTSTSAGHYANDQEEILGTGLGLKIVKDIVQAYRGNIEVVDPQYEFSTCIRIEVPEATEKDLEKL